MLVPQGSTLAIAGSPTIQSLPLHYSMLIVSLHPTVFTAVPTGYNLLSYATEIIIEIKQFNPCRMASRFVI